MRILIVEDEVRLAEALAQIMAEQKYQVDQVHNGADGLDYALTAQYDVIVLDVMLPKLDGLEVARLSDKYSAEVYNLETIAALAFRVESFGAAKVRRALLERIIHGRKEKTTVFVSVVSDGKPNSRWKA